MDMENFLIDGPIGKLSVRTKGLAANPKQIIVLVQGANLTGQTGYDFSFPGGSDYSTMDALVRSGLGTLTFSIRGYGLSEAPADPLHISTDDAIEDLGAVMGWLATHGYRRPHLLGWSWGGRIAGRYTERNAALVDRLILLDPAFGGGNKIPPIPHDPWWINTKEDYLRRLEPEYTDADAREAYANHVIKNDLKAPNGIRMENAMGSIAINPAAISRPTLLIYGSAAARQDYMQGIMPRAEFFDKLNTDDKTFSIIPGGGDYAHIQRPRHLCYQAFANFLSQ